MIDFCRECYRLRGPCPEHDTKNFERPVIPGSLVVPVVLLLCALGAVILVFLTRVAP